MTSGLSCWTDYNASGIYILYLSARGSSEGRRHAAHSMNQDSGSRRATQSSPVRSSYNCAI